MGKLVIISSTHSLACKKFILWLKKAKHTSYDPLGNANLPILLWHAFRGNY